MGAEVRRGSLDDLGVLRAGAADAEGVIHLAFIHDFTDARDAQESTARYGQSVEIDQRAIEAIGVALAGSGRPLVVASGMAVIASDGLATEDDPFHPMFPRAAAAQMTLALAEEDVRSSVVRLPPTVHGEGDKGFVPTLINVARQRGVSGYVGEGTNRWPAVHRFDAATLFQLAVEKAPAGSILHAVGDEGIPTRTIAEAIGDHLGVPVVSVPVDETAEHFGWIGQFFGSIDAAASSRLTQERLGWKPIEPGLLKDLDGVHYFVVP
jgi:nucleoside-diphosphate-sugar epimerase